MGEICFGIFALKVFCASALAFVPCTIGNRSLFDVDTICFSPRPGQHEGGSHEGLRHRHQGPALLLPRLGGRRRPQRILGQRGLGRVCLPGKKHESYLLSGSYLYGLRTTDELSLFCQNIAHNPLKEQFWGKLLVRVMMVLHS